VASSVATPGTAFVAELDERALGLSAGLDATA